MRYRCLKGVPPNGCFSGIKQPDRKIGRPKHLKTRRTKGSGSGYSKRRGVDQCNDYVLFFSRLSVMHKEVNAVKEADPQVV